ncbi:MAG: asparagine synthase-related protein [Candidatus Jordarchaeaceae archaeon]
MSALAGINRPNEFALVSQMLDKISHRASKNKKICSTDKSTFGIISNFHSIDELEKFQKDKMIAHNLFDIHFVTAKEIDGSIELRRDFIGAVPIYFGYDSSNSLCFASEVKSLMVATNDVNELISGTKLFRKKTYTVDNLKIPEKFLSKDIDTICAELRRRIENAVSKRINNKVEFGSWLSGGIDSSIIAAIARPKLKKLYTFVGGLKGSSDIKYAKILADHIKSNHIEIVVNLADILKVLPSVIYHLESFDAYLVRSTIINFLITSVAKDYVEEIFSGESGDELFAGYDYLKFLSISELPQELLNITKALANTAFQRVDRSAYAFGIIPHLPFSDPEIVDYALKIPPDLKIKDGIEKWILRQSMKDILPLEIFNRKKEKFWQGSGVMTLLQEYSESKISDFEFQSNRKLKSGFLIRTKEEYLYYKIFEEHFGKLNNFNWLGFSKIQEKVN